MLNVAVRIAAAVLGVPPHALAVLSIPLHALSVLLLWHWFAVPLGVPPLTLWHAAGISLFVGYIAAPPTLYKDLKEDNGVATVALVLRPLFAIGFGCIYHLLMQ
jgi:hypothetical protein